MVQTSSGHPVCAICGHAGRGETAELHMTHGVSVWLCPPHRDLGFLRRRRGGTFTTRLEAVWRANGMATSRRLAALHTHPRRMTRPTRAPYPAPTPGRSCAMRPSGGSPRASPPTRSSARSAPATATPRNRAVGADDATLVHEGPVAHHRAQDHHHPPATAPLIASRASTRNGARRDLADLRVADRRHLTDTPPRRVRACPSVPWGASDWACKSRWVACEAAHLATPRPRLPCQTCWLRSLIRHAHDRASGTLDPPPPHRKRGRHR